MKKIVLLSLCILGSFAGVKAQYCPPPFYTVGTGGSDYLNGFSCNTISNLNSGPSSSPFQTDYSSTMTTTLMMNNTYTATTYNCPGWTEGVIIWIDYNHNFIFDAAEVCGSVVMSPGGTGTITFTVPPTAVPGLTKMRVRLNYSPTSGFTPCGQYTYGEIEDYGVFIPPPSPIDAATTAITAPVSGCGLTSAETIVATIMNSGTQAINTSSFNMSYSINGGAPVVETTTVNLAQLATTSYSFTTPANLSTAGIYQIKVWCTLAGDTVPIDDTSTISVTNYGVLSTFPTTFDFNSGTMPISFRTTTSTASGVSITAGAANASAFGLQMNGSPVYVAYTTPTATNVWTTNTNRIAKVSLCVDASSSPCPLRLSFDLKQTYLFGPYYSAFRLLINGVQVGPTHFPTTSSSDPFVTITEDLSAYGNIMDITFETRNIYSASYSSPGDNAFIDNVILQPRPPIDVGVILVTPNSSNCGLTSSQLVTIGIKNFGCDTVLANTNIPVSYMLGFPGLPVSATAVLPNDLPVDSVYYYTFATPVNMGATMTNYVFYAWSALGTDPFAGNDTAKINAFNSPLINAGTYYFEGFDSTNLFWTTQIIAGGTQWTVSPSSFAPNVYPISLSKIATFLSGTLAAGSQARLASPCLDLTNMVHPILSFYFGHDNYNGVDDYVTPMYSLDGGVNWINLPDVHRYDPGSGSGQWIKHSFCIDSAAGYNNVKVGFLSYAGGFGDNMAIENVVISNQVVTLPVSGPSAVCSGDQVTIQVQNTDANFYYSVQNHVGATVSNISTGNGGTLTLGIPTLPPAMDTLYVMVAADSIPGTCAKACPTSIPIAVYAYPTPNAGNDTTICTGNPLQINTTGGDSTAVYTWAPTAGLSNPNIGNPLANLYSPGVNIFTVTVTNGGICTRIDTITYTVNVSPVANAGINAAQCYGDTITLGGIPSGQGGTGILSFNWNPAIGLSSGSVANPLCSGLGANTNFELTVTDGNGCFAKDSVYISMSPAIYSQIAITQISCNGASDGSASVLGSGGSGGVTYIWSTAPIQTTSTISNLNANTYIVTVVDTNGCFVRDSAIIIDPAPLALTLVGSNPSTCGLCNGAVQASIAGGTTPYNLSWNSTPVQTTLTANNLCGSTSYVLTATDSHGCVDTLNSPYITGSNIPFNADAGSPQSICNGFSSALGGFPTAIGGNGPYTYNWTPSTALSTTVGPNPQANPSSTTTYQVVVSDIDGCLDSDVVTLTILPVPTANAGPDQFICEGQNVQIGGTPAATGGTPPYSSFYWFPSGSLTASGIANPYASPASATATYTITVTDANGCQDVDNVVVTVHPTPVINAGADQITNPGVSVGLNATGGTSYVWAADPSLSATNIPNPTASPNVTTTYAVTGTDANGCSATDYVVVFVEAPNGIDELGKQIGLTIYPNPFSQSTTIEYTLPAASDINIILFNALGQAVMPLQSGRQGSGKHKVTLDASPLSSGNYLLMIQSDKALSTRKVIKQ